MYVIVCLVALGASFLTLFSGFGLSTLLMPAFALFFPLEAAIAMTAVVHVANNIFKLALVGRKVDKEVLLKFALPGIAAAFVGAWLLTYFSELPPIASYAIGQRDFQISVVKVVIGLLMVGFAFLELHPRFEKMAFAEKWLPLLRAHSSARVFCKKLPCGWCSSSWALCLPWLVFCSLSD